MAGRLKALWLLGWALVRTLLRLLFRRGRRGIAAFRANYDADRLPPVSAEERALMASFGRCIACGRCDVGEGRRIAAQPGRYRGVMALVLSGSRSMPDAWAAAREVEGLTTAILVEKERDCPVGVPLGALLRFVRTKAEETTSSRAVVHTGPG